MPSSALQHNLACTSHRDSLMAARFNRMSLKLASYIPIHQPKRPPPNLAKSHQDSHAARRLSPCGNITPYNHNQTFYAPPVALLKDNSSPSKKHRSPTPELPPIKRRTTANRSLPARSSSTIFCSASDVLNDEFSFMFSTFKSHDRTFLFIFLFGGWGPLGPRGMLDIHPPLLHNQLSHSPLEGSRGNAGIGGHNISPRLPQTEPRLL